MPNASCWRRCIVQTIYVPVIRLNANVAVTGHNKASCEVLRRNGRSTPRLFRGPFADETI